MKNNPKTCDKCGEVFSTKFCPECGRNYNKVPSSPIIFNTYLHSDKSENYELCEEYNINLDSELGKKILYLNYEVVLIYEIIDEDVKIKTINIGDNRGSLKVYSHIYELLSENISGLGHTESTYDNYRLLFDDIDKAKKYAEKEYKEPINWSEDSRNNRICSGDLSFVMYTISEKIIN